MPYNLILPATTMLSHNWPVYYRLKSGRGESPIIRGLLVIDWPGVLVTNRVGWVAGLTLGSLLVMRWSWLFLMIAWFWVRTADPWCVGYMTAAVGDFLVMGKSLGRFMDRYSLFALHHRMRGRGDESRAVRKDSVKEEDPRTP